MLARATTLLLAVGCTPTTAPESVPASRTEPTPTPTSAAEPTSGGWHIGVLGQRGKSSCPSGEEQQWVDIVPTIGDTPIAPLSDAESEWLDHPVVAHGHPGQPPAGEVHGTDVEMCPPAQARSDWEFTPRGLVIDREGGTNHIFFVRDALRPLGELTVIAQDDQLVVDFRNPVPVVLEDVEVRVHYEGCHGKPGTISKPHAVGELGVGAGIQVRFPRIAGADDLRGRGAHRAHSVQIVAHGAGASFDLDVPLAVLNAAVQCPDP